MQITENVILDLAQLYFEGEANEDTKRLVDDYFDKHPKFAEKIKLVFANKLPDDIPLPLNPDEEMLVLKKTQNLLRIRTASLVVAVLGVSFPIFYFTFFDLSGNDYSGYQWLVKDPMALLTWFGVIAWIVYFTLRRRLKVSKL